ncbi:MAG TPA: trypsin-like peptidase domain-containing protein, partial [Candidatus Limnocylindrales bacterium]|nr:trypsin-like peptidase domain-containing protein [Candidatus Limnocylindrales bacterium]
MDEEPDLKLIEEINRQYDGNYEELTVPAHRRRVFFFLKVVTLVLVAVFFFTVAARGLYIFTGPYLSLLRESWELAGDPSVQELREAVVLLSVENHAGVSPQQLSGTGFNIDSEGLIVTNRHLVEDAVSMTVSFPGRGIFVAADWFYSPVVDLAVVKLQAADLPVVKLSEV